MFPTKQLTENDHDVLDATAQELFSLDTGQFIDTGQLLESVADDGNRLHVSFHEIHRIDLTDNGSKELITSTLKYFSLHLAVQDEAGELNFDLDGNTLVAMLVYEDGRPVEDLSATLEPPLLASAGECPPKAVIEGGVAHFRLRITVLSSLCGKQNFCVKITAAANPSLTVTTSSTKTITKLRRGPREGATAEKKPAVITAVASTLIERRAPPASENGAITSGGACGAKRAFTALGEDQSCAQEMSKCGLDAACLGEVLTAHSIDELWEQVALNGAKLLELQAMQRSLFKELRELKAA